MGQGEEGGLKLIKLFVGVYSRQMVVKGKIIDKYPPHIDTTSHFLSIFLALYISLFMRMRRRSRIRVTLKVKIFIS